MKKLLALLLVLMLPVCTIAESRGISLKLSTDETFPQMMEEGMQGSGMSAEEIGSFIWSYQKLIDGLGFEMIYQEDAFSVNLFMGGGTLFDCILRHGEDETVATSSLVPGYALTETLDSSIPSVSFEIALKSAQDAFAIWRSDMAPTVETGSYYGDSFQGGTRCTTWMLTDQDIAALVNALLTSDVRGFLEGSCYSFGLNGVELLRQFDEATSLMAQADTYAYILRLVDDADGQLIGGNLMVITQIDQVATFSFGMQNGHYGLVIGLGMNGFNYWQACDLDVIQQGADYTLNGCMREWFSEKAVPYQDVRATEPIAAYSTSCLLSQSFQRWQWEGSVFVGADFDRMQTLLGYSGSYDQEQKTLQAVAYLGVEPETPIRAELSIGPAEPIPPADDNLIQISSDDVIQFSKLKTSLFNALFARVLELFPSDILTMLMQQ